MKINRIEIFQMPIKLKKPFVISLGSFDYAGNVVVVVHTNEGLKGFGECSPFMHINGESMETAYLVARYLAQALIGKDPADTGLCAAEMDKVIFGNTSIKSAFDIALYDLAAQQAGLPLYKYLGGTNDKTLVTDYTVSIGPAQQMAEDALEIQNRGFKVIKVKVGQDKDQDIQRIKAIRAKIGDEIPLRLDANQGWDVETAISILSELSGSNIQFCEEPIPRWEFMRLSEVSNVSPVMIMADESCCDHHDAARLIGLNACQSFNIKLGKSSGIFKALEIIRLAELADIRLQIGGFLESRIGFTASAHLALTSKNILYCDLDTPMMFSEDPVSGGISYQENGQVVVPEIPGLGAWIENEYLKRLKNYKIE